ncbi:DUF1559 domain-containing protein [Blastopirellula sp. JC732]|uniref:DUF1559 domain-containing protein n=1 Tax=Blastopirellula sediminis TaxID=2894196 RepID=A0A9X1MN39_9BACT|nr:DUF1559 domain-containing protein [Blastopirellula sediminis]MCC9606499.1 DUF1559 domain-containing protein [Blastopirellula sediminis]MCC9630203.1 DUF1559 domain-containing protein [Blastopirellula sediminis]
MSSVETGQGGATSDESPTSEPDRRYVWWIVTAVVVAILGFCLMPIAGGLAWLIETPFTLLFGWVPYSWRTLHQTSPERITIVGWIISVAIFSFGFHCAGRYFAVKWQVRKTIAVVLLIFAATIAGICLIGVGHQAVWIANAPRWVELESRYYDRHDADRDLQQIGNSIKDFQLQKNALPRSTFTPEGRPLHGWMTMILPQIGRMDLYESVTLFAPWDMNYQSFAFDTEVEEYLRRGDLITRDDRDFAVTHYSANKHVIDSARVKSLADVQDGASNTILLGEINDNFPAWARPRNGRDPAIGLNQRGGFGAPWGSGVYFTMGDGSVRFIPNDVDPEVLRALSTPNGGEPPSKTDF